MIAGRKVGVSALLSLADFSLWVLIESVSKMERIDETVHDIAERIVARDLFKRVPCSSEKVAEFISQPHGYARLYEVVEPYCHGKEDYYVLVDRARFKMFEEDVNRMAYFVDGERKAIPVKENDLLRQHGSHEVGTVRIFTVREAVEAARELIAH